MIPLPFLESPLNTQTFSEEEKEAIAEYFEFQKIPKKQMLQRAGTACKELFFVVKGCLHMYFLDENGTQRTTQFALENWWLSDFLNFSVQRETDFFIESVERAEILSISAANYRKLMDEHPKLESYFRRTFEIGYGAAMHRIKYIQSYSKEETYLRFKEQFPDFVQRVPQYLLASFLGLTPEYLSELKKKSIS